MRIAICDDEVCFVKKASSLISSYYSKRGILCTCDEFVSPFNLLAKCNATFYDAVFLDVDMPEQNGIEVAAEIRKISPKTVLLFISAHLEYAPEGYEVEAMRYILKQQMESILPNCLDKLQQKLHPEEFQITLNIGNTDKKVDLTEVLYFEGAQHYVLMYTTSQRRELVAISLSTLEQLLIKKPFLRIHKSYIVNMQYITEMKNYRVKLSNETILRASELKFSQIRSEYLLWQGLNL